MNTRLLETIIAISEEKSLSRAADRLLVTQPALSQQVKKLERELDARLFRREKNQLLLTDAGRIYVNGARSALNIYYRALEEIERQRVSGRRQIILVMNGSLLPDFSTRILPSFAETHPGVFLNVINGNASVAKDYLTGGMAELAVMAAGELTHSILEYLPLRDDELLLSLPQGHPLIRLFRKTGVRLEELADQPFILNRNGSYFQTHERRLFAAARFTPKVLCEISDLAAARHMVAEGKGAAFLPRSLAEPEDGCAYFSLTPPACFHVVLAYHKSTVLAGAMRELIFLFLNAYGET